MRLFAHLVLATMATVLIGTGCTPSVYIIDRPTRLEAEAAGQWPDLEKAAELRSLSLGPQPLPASKKKVETKKPYRIIAGEFPLSKSTKKKPAESAQKTDVKGETP